MYNLLIEHNFLKENLFIIPNMVQFTEKEPVKFKDLLEETRSIVFAGNIHKAKGIFYLLDALNYIDKKVILRIIGDGKHLSEAKKRALKIKTHKIIFINYVQHEEMLTYYKLSKVVVMPSLLPESFGLVGVEGLFAGKPVVALKCWGNF